MRQGSNYIKITVALILLALILVSGAAGVEQAEAQQASSSSVQLPRGPVPEPPELGAEAWALMDAKTGLYLAGSNADEQLQIASTTKIMTALVTLDQGVNLDDEVPISRQAEEFVGTTYSNVGLIAGERVTVQDLLKAALIPSGTEAAYALAEKVGNGSVGSFVNLMNDKASSLGLQNTHFENPAGVYDPNHYGSARDLAIMAQAALKYPVFADIVSTKDATISTNDREIKISNTNLLLTTYSAATGVKTGTSPESGPNLVASADNGDESYIAVVLDDDDRFADSQALLEYGFNRFERRPLVSHDEVYGELELPYRPSQSVELTAEEDIAVPVDANSQVERRVTTDDAPSEAEAGQRLGQVEVLVGGQSVGSTPLVAREGYEDASIFRKAWYGVGYSFNWVWDTVAGLFG